MKRTRILAALLCLMLVVTTIPMIVMAEEETFDTIGDVAEKYAGITDYNSYAYWSMTEKIPSGTPGFTYTPHNATIDPDKGTYIDSSDTSKVFRYYSGVDYWSPLETNKRFVYFKAQVAENEKMEIYLEDTEGARKHGSFTITATEFGEINFGGLYYAREGGAGTEMLEYLIVNDYPNIVKLFAKGEITGDKWVLAANAHTWSGNNENRGLYFTGTGYVKDVTLYEKTETYESLDEIVGADLYSIPNYELNEETTVATGERYTGPIGPSITEGMVPAFRAKLDDADSSMRVIIRKPGVTTADTTCYEFTVTPDSITSNAPLTHLNGSFQAGTDYVDYALFATTTECKVYARSDNQFDGKWVHIVTDTSAYSTDTSYHAAPVIWATTGSFTVNNLKIYQPVEILDTIEEVVGFEPVAMKRFDLTQKMSSSVDGFMYTPYNATVSEEDGTLIGSTAGTDSIFRYYNGDSNWSPLEQGKRFVYFKAKTFESSELQVRLQFSNGKFGTIRISKDAFDKFYFGDGWNQSETITGVGDGWVEYLLVSTAESNVTLYAKSPDLTQDKWVKLYFVGPATGTDSNGNGLYLTGKGYVKEAVLYEKLETYESLDAIAGEELRERTDYEISTETTIATGERFTGPIGPAVTEGTIPVFRAKLDDETSSMRVSIRRPGETSGNYVSYEFTVSSDAITSNAALYVLNEGFKAGTGYVDYALFATTTECKVYAKSDTQFDGKWVHVLTDKTAQSSDNSFYASPAIWAMTGSFTVNNLKVYQNIPPVETYATISDILGYDVRAARNYDLTTSNYGVAASPAALEQGVGVNMNNGGYWRVGGDGKSALGEGKAIYFRARAEEGKNTYFHLHIPDETKTEATYSFMLNENGIGTTDNVTHNAHCYEAAGSHVSFKPGTEFAEYLAVDKEDGTGLHIYARQDGLYDDKWIQTSRIVGYFPNLSGLSEFYMTTNGTLSAVKMYEKAEFYATVDEVVGESVIATKTFTDFMRYTPSSTYSPLTNGAVTFNATACEDGKAFRVYIHDPNTEKNAYAFKITKDGIFKVTDNAPQNIVMSENFVPGTEAHDYLVIENESKNGVLVYVKNTEGKWAPVFEITGHTLDTPYSDTYGLYIFGEAESKAVLNSAAIYTTNTDVVPEDVTKPAGTTNLYFEDDFSGKREYRKTMLYASVDAGNLVVSPTEESSGYGVYEALRTSIPVGGYAELKVMGNSKTGIILSDGASVLTLGSDGITTDETDVLVGDGSSYWTWRILRNADGTYNGYCCMENGTVWYKAFENVEATVQEGNTRIGLIQYGVGEIAKIDYLKVFAPLTATEELTLIDGMGNNPMLITDGTANPDYSTMTALVKQGEEEKILLIAEYSEQGLLSKLTTQNVPVGNGVTSLIYDATADSVKVFLWDGFPGITNLTDATSIYYEK